MCSVVSKVDVLRACREFTSREDVVRCLDAVIKYLELYGEEVAFPLGTKKVKSSDVCEYCSSVRRGYDLYVMWDEVTNALNE